MFAANVHGGPHASWFIPHVQSISPIPKQVVIRILWQEKLLMEEILHHLAFNSIFPIELFTQEIALGSWPSMIMFPGEGIQNPYYWVDEFILYIIRK